MDDSNLDTRDSEVLESVGVGEPTEGSLEESEQGSSAHSEGDGNQGKVSKLPEGVKQRLGRQEKRHQRELRQLREELATMQQLLGQQPTDQGQQIGAQNYGAPNEIVDDQIHKAVSHALRAQEEQRRMALQKEQMDHVNRRYEDLQNSLDKASDKYDDFDDIVRAKDAPFTEAMRDAALFLDNPAEVLYKLGKNKDELKRISQLHPLEQAREMIKLSHALMSGSKEDKNTLSARPIGQIKSNPVSQSSINDKTPVSEIRRKMKAGDWKGLR